MSSLIGIEQYAPSAIESYGGGAEAPASHREVNLLKLAWGSRWLVLLGMILGGSAGWFLMQCET